MNTTKSNLVTELIEIANKNERTGIVLLDNLIADALNEKRMASKAEIVEIKEISNYIKHKKVA